MSKPLHIIILAAGDGTRMKSNLPKVLHTVGGRPMLAHVVDTASHLSPAAIHVVYNPASPEVRQACASHTIQWVEQAERLGTGHAVMQAMPGVPEDGTVMVLYGDTPLVPHGLLAQLVEDAEFSLKVLSMSPDDPTGYGRLVRDEHGRITGIVEERDATRAQKAVREVNSGIVLAAAADLARWLGQLGNDNDQGEYYLTDIFALAHAEHADIGSVMAPDASLLAGANDRAQLAALERRYQLLAAQRLMADGAQLADPARVDVRGTVRVGPDVWIDINVVLQGSNELGEGVQIGPGCVLTDCHLAPGTRVHAHSVLEGVLTRGACDIGPFARVRPGTELGAGSKVGNFVEIKNTRLGAGSKASHLSYLGDSEIGQQVNIGAGTITCNYDGVNKHRTVIGDGAFIGSDTQLIAPVKVGRNANIGAGTTLTKDAPDEQLTLSRTRQVTLAGWRRPKKRDPGSDG